MVSGLWLKVKFLVGDEKLGDSAIELLWQYCELMLLSLLVTHTLVQQQGCRLPE